MANISKKWVVLCSAAISAVYAAGYFATESQASKPGAAIAAHTGTGMNRRSEARHGYYRSYIKVVSASHRMREQAEEKIDRAFVGPCICENRS